MRTTERLERLLLMVPWLEAHPGATWERVCARFDVTEDELVRDLELLDNCSLPGEGYLDMVEIDYDGDRITVRQAQGLARPLRLTPAEATALIVAGHALLDVPGAADSHLSTALDKIAIAAGSVATMTPAPAASPGLNTIREALRTGRQLRLSYLVVTRDELTTRTVSPVGLEAQETNIYLEAWCHDAGGMRLFRLDNVVAAELLEEPATPGVRTSEPARTTATVHLQRRARWVAEAHETRLVEEHPDGGLTVELDIADPEWIVQLMLRLGGEAQVLAPASLAERVLQAARSALARTVVTRSG